MTPNELADKVEAFFKANPNVSRFKFAMFVRGRGGLVNGLRSLSHLKPGTAEKILGVIANPPSDLLKQTRGRDRCPQVATMRRAAALRRQGTQAAQKLLDEGIDPNDVKRAVVRQAMYALADRNRQDFNQLDPTQQAIRILQRRMPTYSAHITGGPKGMFYHGAKLIDQEQLLSLAGVR